MKNYTIPAYYTDSTLSEEEKRRLDWEMIVADFPNYYGSPHTDI